MTGRARSLLLASTAAAAVLALPACEADGSAPAKADGGPSVVAPGKPGEAAETLSADEARKAGREDSVPNAADVRFVRMMIVHHRQALTMAALADKHADSKGVKGIARRIAAAQGPEIGALEGWLDQRGEPREEKEGHGHDHGAMPGMATQAELDRLSAARGDAFDELFVKLMTTHHQGAVTMATEVLKEGNDVLVEEMATEMSVQQTAEIGRMREL
ncbi:DUF305 domain-containing protein [Streptomyces sp. WAC 00631]|uniref:DUF305 domain-containing protein n=1 Tax=unclassified Streptomyces TaxID=2593676 RepID=UPI000F791F60|nr:MULTISPECIES: DUF305 domain-containing protein [unclassified Streptomyces]MCC5036814.1 DUF305 domain-containing protein [Streptomyces sp. WAC 00631]MCC9738050.1 DUF305 domain-containing protein [Streptomyces sp. MNU89]